MLGPQAALETVDGRAKNLFRFGKLVAVAQQQGQVAGRHQRIEIVRTENSAARFQQLAVDCLGFVQLRLVG